MVVMTVLLAACSTPEERAATVDDATNALVEPTPLTSDVIMTLGCDEVTYVAELVDDLRRNNPELLEQWIPEETDTEAVQIQLDTRKSDESVCPPDPEDEGSPTAPATEEPENNETGSTSDPTITAPAAAYGWKIVFDEPPAGLKEMVEANSGLLGWDWAKVKAWAEDGGDARVVLVFDNETPDLASARKAAGVGVIPVVHVTSCATLSEQPCPDDGVIVVLAPLGEDDKPSLATGTAVWVGEDGATVLYDLTGTQVVPED